MMMLWWCWGWAVPSLRLSYIAAQLQGWAAMPSLRLSSAPLEAEQQCPAAGWAIYLPKWRLNRNVQLEVEQCPTGGWAAMPSWRLSRLSSAQLNKNMLSGCRYTLICQFLDFAVVFTSMIIDFNKNHWFVCKIYDYACKNMYFHVLTIKNAWIS